MLQDLITPYQQADREQAQMQALVLMQARQKKREAQGLAAGRLVRITFYLDGQVPHPIVYPARVAAFARRCLGEPLLTKLSQGVRFSFSSAGAMELHTYASQQAALAMTALMAHVRADQKLIDRRLAAERRKLQPETTY